MANPSFEVTIGHQTLDDFMQNIWIQGYLSRPGKSPNPTLAEVAVAYGHWRESGAGAHVYGGRYCDDMLRVKIDAEEQSYG